MMKDKVVEILGTLYTIHFDVPDGKMPEGADGCMDQSFIRSELQNLNLTEIQFRIWIHTERKY